MVKEMKFKCQRCGQCCKGPGDINVSFRELSKAADFLGIPLREGYVFYEESDQLKLVNRTNTGCIFLHNNQCIIYPVRPEQCRTFPDWPDIDMDAAKKVCPELRKHGYKWTVKTTEHGTLSA